MLGKTHLVLGAASALLLTLPGTVPGLITAVTAGALGGWIVDIDAKEKNKKKNRTRIREPVYLKVLHGLLLGGILLLDLLIGKEMSGYVADHWGLRTLAALLTLAALTAFGAHTEHRTFTHSLPGFALFCGAMYLFCRPAALPFLIGYASHILADLCNFRALQLFYPLKRYYSLKLCPSNGRENRILGWVCLGLTLALGAVLLWVALSAAG